MAWGDGTVADVPPHGLAASGAITGRMTARVRFSARMISTTAWGWRRGGHSATEVGLRTAAAAAEEEEEEEEEEEVREVRDGGASPR